MIFLSIIIPHYNLPRELLKRCVDSVISQNMESGRYEIIVVDDGSEDTPLWINDLYPSDSVRLFTIEHAGPGAARNRGLDEARGKYIQFVDADDSLVPGSMSRCLELLHTESPKIMRYKYRIRNDAMKEPDVPKKQPFKYSYIMSGAAYMAQKNLSGSPCVYFFQRDLAVKYGIRFDENVFHEDEEFNVKLHYYATTLIDTNEYIYNYCIRKESTTANSNSEFENKRLNDLFVMLKRITEFRDSVSAQSNPVQQKGLERKTTMLTVDVLLNLFYNGMGVKEILLKCETVLAPLGLYPLPVKYITLKYTLFRMLANNKLGLSLLRVMLPKCKPLKK